jgi:hypothetical protein
VGLQVSDAVAGLAKDQRQTCQEHLPPFTPVSPVLPAIVPLKITEAGPLQGCFKNVRGRRLPHELGESLVCRG